MLYDLVIKGGHVFDPGRKLDDVLDIGVSAGRISAIKPESPSTEAKRMIDVRGANRDSLEANAGLIAGLKLRLVGPLVEERGEERTWKFFSFFWIETRSSK